MSYGKLMADAILGFGCAVAVAAFVLGAAVVALVWWII